MRQKIAKRTLCFLLALVVLVTGIQWSKKSVDAAVNEPYDIVYSSNKKAFQVRKIVGENAIPTFTDGLEDACTETAEGYMKLTNSTWGSVAGSHEAYLLGLKGQEDGSRERNVVSYEITTADMDFTGRPSGLFLPFYYDSSLEGYFGLIFHLRGYKSEGVDYRQLQATYGFVGGTREYFGNASLSNNLNTWTTDAAPSNMKIKIDYTCSEGEITNFTFTPTLYYADGTEEAITAKSVTADSILSIVSKQVELQGADVSSALLGKVPSSFKSTGTVAGFISGTTDACSRIADIRVTLRDAVTGLMPQLWEAFEETQSFDNAINYLEAYNSLSTVEKSDFAEQAEVVREWLISEFREEYETTLALTEKTVVLSDKTSVELALNVYNGCNDKQVQTQLEEEKKILDSLKQRIDELELMTILGKEQPVIDENTGSYTFTDDFESSYCTSWWTKTPFETTAGKTTEDGGIALEMEHIKDTENEGNHLLQVDGVHGMVTPYWFMIPDHVAMKKVSYDVVKFDVEGWRLRICVGYQDEDNASYLDFCYEEEKGWAYRYACMIGGSSIYQGAKTYVGTELNLTEGFHVEINYDISRLKAYLTLSSLEDPDISTNITMQYGSQKYIFALPCLINIWYTGTSSYKSICYDNVSVEYVHGDWDDDVDITDANVYYTGNTLILPGDTALVSGEQLGSVVKEIEIVELPKETSTFGYILQDQYNAKATEAKYTASSDAKAVYEAVLDAEGLASGTKVDIVQQTDSAVQFIIPDNFSLGVYAVKITPRGGKEPTYVYINRPCIDYTVGDEGEIVTVGGSVRVIGKYLALLSENEDITTDTAIKPNDLGVKAILKNASGTTYNCDVTAVQSVYSVTVSIPDTVKAGIYELSVYNGFGGDSAWAAPVSITVGASPRADWSDTIFNVTDYGADPKEDTIDTDAFINALEAASLNDEDGDGVSDGGIVYVPAGIYCITATIPIPSKVQLVGDGSERTHILFSSAHYDFGQLPTAIIAVQGNAEIKGLAILSTRAASVIRAGNLCENVYIDDVHIETHPYKGTIGNGAGGQTLLHYTELSSLVYKENTQTEGMAFDFEAIGQTPKGYSKNIQITNCVAEHFANYRIVAKYLYMANNDIGSYQMGGLHDYMILEASIFENNTRTGRRAGGNFDGYGYYMDGNEFGDVNSNNSEIITTDGGLDYGMSLSGIVRKIDEYEDGCHYQFADGTSYKDDFWNGKQLMVQSGQGAFQKRNIVDSYGNVLVLDSPFVVEPNRNSRVSIELPRDNWYYVNCETSSGAYIGTYGTEMGSVFDGNKFSFCKGLYFYTAYGAPVWYISVVNNELTDNVFWHVHDEGDREMTGPGGIIFSGYKSGELISMVTIRGNDLQDDGVIWLNSPNTRNLTNFVIERNHIADATYGVVYGANEQCVDGVFMKDMTYTNVKYPVAGGVSGSVEWSFDTTILQDSLNDYNIARFCIRVPEIGAEDLGDVNMDGTTDIADLKLIRLYLVGRLEFTDEMLARADVNADDYVNMQDVLQLAEKLRGI